MRLESLTFLRFLAAIVVVVFHYGRNIEGVKDLPSIFYAGPQMVTFFFVLSGFVMALAHYGKSLEVGVFYIKRIARIVPVYLLALFLYFVVTEAEVRGNLPQIIYHVLFLQSWLPPNALSLNGPAWSLSVEAFFYVVFPFVFLVFKGGGRSLFVAIFVWLFTQIVLVNLLEAGFYEGYPSISHDLIYYFPPVHLSSFLLGYVGGAWFLENKERFIWRGSDSMFLPVVGFLIIGFSVQYASLFGLSLGVSIPVAASFLAPIFLVFIFCFSFSENKITEILSKRFFRVLGDASFSVYILQSPLHAFYYKNLGPLFNFSDIVNFLLYLSFLVSFSILVFYFFEKPINNMFRGRLIVKKKTEVYSNPC